MGFRLAAMGLLVAHVGCLCGAPLSAYRPADQGQPFACKHHGCGCRTAAQCWRACCCYSPAAKAAWARRAGVAIPAWAAFEVDASMRVVNSASELSRGCCAAHGAGDQEEVASLFESPMNESPATDEPSWTIERCHGVHAIWVAMSAALPLVYGATPRVGLSPTGRLTLKSPIAPRPHRAPPVPPPRLAPV